MPYIVSTDIQRISLNEKNTITSVLQNVSIILRTRLGTVPLYREFGVSNSYLDRPVVVAEPLLYAEIKEAIEQYEPRAEVIDISFAQDPEMQGVLIPTVEVNIISEQE